MKVSKTEEHGLRLVMTLAREGRQMTISKLAEEEGLSEALIAKLLGMLRKGGVVKAERGRKGGYELAASPERITVAQVVRSLGPALFRGCLEKGGRNLNHVDCSHVGDCGLRPVWAIIEEKITQMLDQVSLADLVREESEMERKVRKIWPHSNQAQA